MGLGQSWSMSWTWWLISGKWEPNKGPNLEKVELNSYFVAFSTIMGKDKGKMSFQKIKH